MPVLDAKALKTDKKGLAFLKDVLRRDQTVQDSKAEDRKAASRVAKRLAAPRSDFALLP